MSLDCEYKHEYLKDDLIPCQLSKIIRVKFSPTAYDLVSHRFCKARSEFFPMQQGSNPQQLVSLMTTVPILQQWSLLAQQVGMAPKVHI